MASASRRRIVCTPAWIPFAWLYEFTPQGIKRESEVPPDASIARQTGRKLDLTQFSTLTLKDALPEERQEADNALALGPHNEAELVMRGNADVAEGKIARGKVEFQRSLALDPPMPMPTWITATFCRSNGGCRASALVRT